MKIIGLKWTISSLCDLYVKFSIKSKFLVKAISFKNYTSAQNLRVNFKPKITKQFKKSRRYNHTNNLNFNGNSNWKSNWMRLKMKSYTVTIWIPNTWIQDSDSYCTTFSF